MNLGYAASRQTVKNAKIRTCRVLDFQDKAFWRTWRFCGKADHFSESAQRALRLNEHAEFGDGGEGAAFVFAQGHEFHEAPFRGLREEHALLKVLGYRELSFVGGGAPRLAVFADEDLVVLDPAVVLVVAAAVVGDARDGEFVADVEREVVREFRLVGVPARVPDRLGVAVDGACGGAVAGILLRAEVRDRQIGRAHV